MWCGHIGHVTIKTQRGAHGNYYVITAVIIPEIMHVVRYKHHVATQYPRAI